ncbi:MAG: 2-oxo acid dehydrogenase subunit E2 [Gammaproteobacteria bacterium]
MTTELTISADELEGTTASVSVWIVNEGDIVSAGQPVLELETDKVSMEVCAHQSGVLSDIQVKVGEDVEADMALAHIRPADTETVSEDSEASTEKDVEESSTETLEDKAKHRLSPAVRRLMQENQLTAEEVTGSGRNGRVTREDVEQYLALQQTTHAQNTAIKTNNTAPSDTPAVSATSRKVAHTRIRKSIADHMVSSLLHTSPHVTSVFEMDMSNIIAHRKWHKNACARVGGKLTFTAYFAYAAALACQEVPQVNARYHEDCLELFNQVHMGIGTALGDDGLVVPVIRDVDSKELYEIAIALTEQTDKARNGNLTPDDLKGSTLTISNHGVSGSLFATPIIINQPEVAILGVGKLQKRAVVVEQNGEDVMVIKPMCYVSLTIDHRALDAHQTNLFLSHFVDTIENWEG